MGALRPSLSTGVLPLLAAFLVIVTAAPTGEGQTVTLSVNTDSSKYSTDRRYLSVTISGGQLRKGLVGYEFSSVKLQNLAKALSPANVRIGGTYSDFFQFEPDLDDSTYVDPVGKPDKDIEKLWFKLSGKRWDDISTFCATVDWSINWDFSRLVSLANPWNATLAKQFLEYSAAKGVEIPMFELGNEPNLYERKFGVDIEAEQFAKDYLTLKSMLAGVPKYANSGVYGPGVTNLEFNSARKYLAKFLQNGGCTFATEVALHYYDFKTDEASLSLFTDVEVMNKLKTQLDLADSITLSNCGQRPPITFTETATSSGGGVPDVSNAFVAGFLWLDKLGLSATYGITRIYRQTFLKSSYALVTKNLVPNPDYYLSVMYKRLVEGPVFDVNSATLPETVRVYANCVGKSFYSYQDGAIVVSFLNVGDAASVLSLSQFSTATKVHLFVFTPGDDLGMLSRGVKLNGDVLTMDGDDLPAMDPLEQSSLDVTLSPKTYGFIVIPDADVQLCKDYN